MAPRQRKIYLDGQYLFSETERGRSLICRLSDGLPLAWDRKAGEEFAFGKYKRHGNRIVITVRLSDQLEDILEELDDDN